MFELKTILHRDLTCELLEDIISLKSVFWSYNHQEHLDWIYKNLNDTDIHVFLLHDKTIIAYLNLIQIEVVVDEKKIQGFGIGNVCAKERGHGWGKLLIDRVNDFIVNSEKIGLLFCKNGLVNFYTKCNWKIVSNLNTNSIEIKDNINVMVFNFIQGFSTLEYFGRMF